MNFATLASALIPLAIKYGPLIFAFIQTQGPGVQAFIQEIETELKAAKNADGTVNWPALLPVLFKYAPQAILFINQQGVPFQTIISDVMGALKGQSVTTTPTVPSPVLSGPNFQFKS